MSEPVDPPILRIPCRGVLFDCDGVLVDSIASAERVWTRWAVEYGLEPADVLAVMHGRRSADTIASFIEDPRERAVSVEKIERYEIADAAGVVAIPGAGALTRDLPAGVWAVVTSASARLARARLGAAGLPEPPTLITADDITAGKPEPEGYLAAADALGLPAHETVVFEDSAAGVKAGHAAGVACVVGVGVRALDTEAAVVVPDLRDVWWEAGALHVPGARLLRS